MRYVLLACAAAALLSLLVLPSAPLHDQWAWIVWGRELVHLDLDASAGPAWKPLPVAITGVLSGGAAAWLPRRVRARPPAAAQPTKPRARGVASAQLTKHGWRSPAFAQGVPRIAAAAIVLAAVAIGAWRIARLADELEPTTARAGFYDDLGDLVARAGGPGRLRACGVPYAFLGAGAGGGLAAAASTSRGFGRGRDRSGWSSAWRPATEPASSPTCSPFRRSPFEAGASGAQLGPGRGRRWPPVGPSLGALPVEARKPLAELRQPRPEALEL